MLPRSLSVMSCSWGRHVGGVISWGRNDRTRSPAFDFLYGDVKLFPKFCALSGMSGSIASQNAVLYVRTCQSKLYSSLAHQTCSPLYMSSSLQTSGLPPTKPQCQRIPL